MPNKSFKFVDVGAARSRNMASIRSKGTSPELVVRRLIHALGYRFRLHCSDLPGCPDIVLRPRKKVIEVRGCFWHSHEARSCNRAHVPKTRLDYWRAKLERNVARDAKNVNALKRAGWDVLVLWECEVGKPQTLQHKLTRFLEGRRK